LGSNRHDKPIDYVEARHARPAMRRRLLRRQGGGCYIVVGEVSRLLWHDPMLQAAPIRLPWPFYLLQPYQVRYSEVVDGQIINEQDFGRFQIDAAVTHFLRDVGPEEEIALQPGDGER
jgi:hypothetical protein